MILYYYHLKNDQLIDFLLTGVHAKTQYVVILYFTYSWKVLCKLQTTMRVCLTSFLIKILQNLSTGRFHCISFLSIEADRNVDTCYLFNGWNSDNESMYTVIHNLTNIRSTTNFWHSLKKIMHVKLRSKANVSLLNNSCVSHY